MGFLWNPAVMGHQIPQLFRFDEGSKKTKIGRPPKEIRKIKNLNLKFP